MRAPIFCRFVIHTACPVILGVPKSQAFDKLIFPAVRGTQNVLNSVDRAGSVEKGKLCALSDLQGHKQGGQERKSAFSEGLHTRSFPA